MNGELENDDNILNDGETRRVSMYMIDGIQRIIAGVSASASPMHQPGPIAFSDADRAARAKLYEDAEARLTNAWKEPPPVAPVTTDTVPPMQMKSADRTSIYAAYNARIQSQWESPL